MSKFHDYLRSRLATDGFSTEDALASFLPLVREVLEAHAAGRVAPLEGLDALRVEGARIWFEEAHRLPPRDQAPALRRVETAAPAAVTIVAQTRRTLDLEEGDAREVDLSIGSRDAAITRPVYLPGYVTWEHQLGHHDPLTDVFGLGMILASLACGLDFAEPGELRTFVAGRRNLFGLKPGLHPVLAQAIVRMTELDRHRRAQDLRALLHWLENYRDQEIDFDLELARIPDFGQQDDRSKQHAILTRLRERLFEISRRNRLLQFRATLQTVNLTHASVPLSFDIAHIRPDQILVWNASLHAALAAGEPVSLNKYLNFAEVLYLPSMFDRIIAQSRRDQVEFGFGQLRLAICFLHWANFKDNYQPPFASSPQGSAASGGSGFVGRPKEKPAERFSSPLVLLPVELKKKKGIRDTYILSAPTSQAEVNPVVRHQFKQLYDIELPETIDLASTTLDRFHEYLAGKIAASEPAVALDKIDRPRIALLYDRAKRKLDQYRRRARLAGRGVRSYQDLDYSYDAANYHPLGIALFSTRIRPPATHLRTLIEEKPRPRSYAIPEPEPPAVERERVLFHIEDGSEENPYHWNFDLCNVTLGNFQYRKMSLVRDYETLLADRRDNAAFEAAFSLAPRQAQRQLPPALPLEERFHVVPCDPTQASAIEEARAGKSYIIQGPPGTGKSQTITNLIADYVARGKRVLFVCEKRAAIDVVFARLRQCGLGELCCLLHDSQGDKKAFILELKQSYEAFLAETDATSAKKRPREKVLERLKNELEPLERFDAAMQKASQRVGVPLRQLLRRGIELRDQLPRLSPLEKERLPHYATWSSHRDRIAAIAACAQDVQPDGILARHPLGRLSPRLAKVERPLELVAGVLQSAEEHLQALDATLGRSGIPAELWNSLAQASVLVDYCMRVAPLAGLGKFRFLDASARQTRQFTEAVRRLRRQQEAVDQARQQTSGWREGRKLPRPQLAVALEEARFFALCYFPWLRPDWWRLRRILNASYDFRSKAILPYWTFVLSALEDEYKQLDELERQRRELVERFDIPEVDAFIEQVEKAAAMIPNLPARLGRFHQDLMLKADQAAATLDLASRAADPLRLLASELDEILHQHADLPLDQLRGDLRQMGEALDDLPAFLQCLTEMASLPETLASTLCRLALPPAAIEAAVADNSLAAVYREDRRLASFTGAVRNRHVKQLQKLHRQWLAGNADELRRRVKERFLENVRLSSLSATQLDTQEKDLKKRYSRGRRELEHEFGKTMRFKSIRDLVSGDSGEVLKDLKPVWLMSPLSVSDALPMDASYFDVVIFDEASQITLEEAVPSLFRAGQAIVVGDEMQLPPTDFFSARQSGQEDEELAFEEEGELVRYDLASNSFLNHAAKNLSATMLGWHYRSRSESLVSFSNWAFYDGRLLTVPEETLPAPDRKPLRIAGPGDAVEGAAELLARSISFHQLTHGVYDKRRNRAEAEYIARLVRELLMGQNGRSIGVIAFSEAQQDEIESALARLAQEDAPFAELLDAEWEREVDGQFVGLLVKNLENIQGDERDLVILSVCYGRGPNGKMLMNFGPINQSGGERRLNVAFSRAKHHMAVVSSIQSQDITNDYNDGAACLKNYLRYAEAVSEGNREAAARVLHGMSRWHGTGNELATGTDDPVARQIADALIERGYLVDHAVGQSHFRCDLAVRRTGDTTYRLAILLDNDAYYEQSDLLERDLMRPRLLADFGWNVTLVLAKDWYENAQAVLGELIGLLET